MEVSGWSRGLAGPGPCTVRLFLGWESGARKLSNEAMLCRRKITALQQKLPGRSLLFTVSVSSSVRWGEQYLPQKRAVRTRGGCQASRRSSTVPYPETALPNSSGGAIIIKVLEQGLASRT